MSNIKTTTILAGLFIILFSISCEDPIDVDSGFEGPQIVVDGWITNEPETQVISITESQDFFDNRLPTGIENAIVTVTNGTQTHFFTHSVDGRYEWTPPAGEGIGVVGDELILGISIDETVLVSRTMINRVPEIDSISIFFEEEAFGADPGLFAEVYATDFPGKGDTYWVKSYRNDTLLNRPRELNIIFDATFDAGTDIDGTTFIRPLRFAVNALDDNGIPRDLNNGDRVRSEIYSISNEAFQFLQIVQEQTSNGDNTIFALPIANARSNIFDQNGNPALGIFNVAAKSSLEVTVVE